MTDSKETKSHSIEPASAEPRDPLGIKNVCFSVAETMPGDERQDEWKEQRETRGFDETELWNLDVTISRFIVPRLEAYLEECKKEGICHGCGPSAYLAFVCDKDSSSLHNASNNWIKTLEKIIEAHKLLATRSEWSDMKGAEEKEKLIEEGLDLFCKHYRELWY